MGDLALAEGAQLVFAQRLAGAGDDFARLPLSLCLFFRVTYVLLGIESYVLYVIVFGPPVRV
jgi:hypothetical protein